jgi:uncharacterized protein YrzB (UPF0473 family)
LNFEIRREEKMFEKPIKSILSHDGNSQIDTDSLEGEGKFTIKNAEEEEIECEILFTFDSEETKKSYIVFTDSTFDENGNIKVYANTYDSFERTSELGMIETEKEWDIIESLLISLKNEFEDSSDND